MARIKFLIIASLIFAALDSLLVQGDAQKGLFSFKEMVPLRSSSAAIPLQLKPGVYMLKVKHQIRENQEKVVFFNHCRLLPYKIRKKKVIETDYFYLQPGCFGKNNLLRVEFGAVFPSDIDLRLNNFIPLPREEMSDDLFILFKKCFSGYRFGFFPWLLNFFLFFLIFAFDFDYLKKRGISPEAVTRKAGIPFFLFCFALLVNNFLPFSPYLVLMSSFFFWLTFSVSFLLTQAVIAPASKSP